MLSAIRDGRVAVIGLGYVGLPTACMFATQGVNVLGVDSDQRLIDLLGEGHTSLAEPEVQTLVTAAINSGRLELSTDLQRCDAYIVAVPTPVGDDHAADLSYVRRALADIKAVLTPGALVILESTVPPGTTRDVIVAEIEQSGLRAGLDVMIAHCPERVLPGSTMHELINNDRIIGGIDRESAERAADLYSVFVRGRIHCTDATTAEMVKVMENTFRDVNIALANDFAKIADRIGVDVWEAISLANNHPRVNVLRPGPGVGGHCIAVDPWFLVQIDAEASRLLRAAREVNDAMPRYVCDRLLQSADLRGGHVAVLGLAYRANLGDTRESPALTLIEHLLAAGLTVRAHDPYVTSQCLPVANEPIEQALSGASAVVVATDHRDFAELDPVKVARLVGQALIFDTRNCIASEEWTEAGFEVITLGRGNHNGTAQV